MERNLIETTRSPAVHVLFTAMYAEQGVPYRKKPVYRLRAERLPRPARLTEVNAQKADTPACHGVMAKVRHIKKRSEIPASIIGRKIRVPKIFRSHLMGRFHDAAAEGRSVDVVQWGGDTLTYQIGKVPKPDRPLCGAKTRAGGECKARCVDGMQRCRMHGGLSTGPITEEGRAKVSTAVIASNKRRAELRRQVEGYVEKPTPTPRKLIDHSLPRPPSTWNRRAKRPSAGKALADRLIADAMAEVLRAERS